jgi:hypothetical protein
MTLSIKIFSTTTHGILTFSYKMAFNIVVLGKMTLSINIFSTMTKV